MKKVSATLSNEGEAWFNDVSEGLTVDNQPPGESRVVNYAIETMIALEKTLSRVANIHDPVEFIEGVNNGSIIIVNHGKTYSSRRS